MDKDQEEIVEMLQEGNVGVLPTDTLYGLVGSALNPEAVERIYTLKERDASKPLIVLISNIDELERFGVIISEELKEQLSAYWPGKNSIILPTVDEEFEYIHRGKDMIAFRLPDNDELLALLQKTGPLVAPSVNPEGMPPAKSVAEAQKYFGSDIAFYIDGGVLEGPASTLLRYDDGKMVVIRE